MVAGFDRYFQIAPCFRDEDARADRSPGEFYQLDIEMSFVTQEDIFRSLEELLSHIFGKFSDKKIAQVPFPHITYRDAMMRFGCDKPDLRNPIEMMDVSEVFQNSGFNAFAGAIKNGGVVRSMVVRSIADKPRKFFDDMVAFSQSLGAKGLAYIVWENGQEKSPIVKFLSRGELDKLKQLGAIKDGDVMFFLADKEKKVCEVGSQVRMELANRLGLMEKDIFKFC